MTNRQKRTLIALLAVLAVLVLALVLVLRANHRRDAAAASSSASASAVTPAQAEYTALTWNNGTATLSFTRDDGGNWSWADDADFPLNNDYLVKLTNTLSGLVPQQSITDHDALDAYGLDEPAMTLTAAAADGTKTVLALGNEVTGGSGSYYMLMNSDESTVYVIPAALHDELALGIYDMMTLPQLPTLTQEQISSIDVEGKASTLLSAVPGDGSETADSSAAASSASGAVTWRCEGANVTDNDSAKSLIAAAGTLAVSRAVDYKPGAEAVKLCGLEQPRASLTVAYTDDKGKDGTLKLRVGGQSADGKGCYVLVNDDTTIYAMDAESLASILAVADGGLQA